MSANESAALGDYLAWLLARDADAPPADPRALFPPDYTLMAMYAPLMAVSLSTNALLIFVAFKFNFLKSATNIFLVNLALADLLVACLCMPIQLSKAYTLFWYFGDTVCKFVNYIQGVAVSASVFTLSAMAVERSLSIKSAPRLRPPGRRHAVLIVIVIWIFASLIFSPLIIVASVTKETIPTSAKIVNGTVQLETKDVYFCIEAWPSQHTKEQFGIASFTLVYAIPGCIIIACYASIGRTLRSIQPPCDMDEGSFSMQQSTRLTKERRRIARMLMSLAGVFALCWLPYNVLQLMLDTNAVPVTAVSALLPYALLAGHANSSINPIIYCLLTRNFQSSISKLFCGKPNRCPAKFTWKCTKNPVGSSSDQQQQHEQHKRCYLQMTTLRYRHCISYPAQTQCSRVTRTSRRTVPPRTLSVEMLQRHSHPDYKV